MWVRIEEDRERTARGEFRIRPAPRHSLIRSEPARRLLGPSELANFPANPRLARPALAWRSFPPSSRDCQDEVRRRLVDGTFASDDSPASDVPATATEAIVLDPRDLDPEAFMRKPVGSGRMALAVRRLGSAVLGRGIHDPAAWGDRFQVPRRLSDAIGTLPRLALDGEVDVARRRLPEAPVPDATMAWRSRRC